MNSTTNIPANETLRQLGGAGRLSAMVGAKNFMHADDGRRLSFRIMGGLHVDVTICADDLYAVKVQRVRGMRVSLVAEVASVGVESLVSVLEHETRLAWRL